MNKLILSIITILLVFSSPVKSDQKEFCDGFKAGYITGYKQSTGSSYDPYPPYCPYQPYKGYNDPESDYEHGYIIGYEKGKQKGSSR